MDNATDHSEVLPCDHLTPTIPASALQEQVVIDLTQENETMSEPEARVNEFVYTFLMILHAHKCQQMGSDHTCFVRGCDRIKSVLRHINSCCYTYTHVCQVDGCNTVRGVISHWRNCSDDICARCIQLRSKLRDITIRKQQDIQGDVPGPSNVSHQPDPHLQISAVDNARAPDVTGALPMSEGDQLIEYVLNNSAANGVQTPTEFTPASSLNIAMSSFPPSYTSTSSRDFANASASPLHSAFTPLSSPGSGCTPMSSRNIADSTVGNFSASTTGLSRSSLEVTSMCMQCPTQETDIDTDTCIPQYNSEISTNEPPHCATLNDTYPSEYLVNGDHRNTRNASTFVDSVVSVEQNTNPLPCNVADSSSDVYIHNDGNQITSQRDFQNCNADFTLDASPNFPQAIMLDPFAQPTTRTSFDETSVQASRNALDQPGHSVQESQSSIDEILDTSVVSGQSETAELPRPSGPVPTSPLHGRRRRPFTPRWCRNEYESRVHLTCLRDPSTLRTGNIDLYELQRLGLGIAYHEDRGYTRGCSTLFTDWDRTEVDNYILDVFPALRQTAFHFCIARAYGRLQRLPEECRSGLQLRQHFLSMNRRTTPVLYIRPDNRLDDIDLQQALDLSRSSPQLIRLTNIEVDYADSIASDDCSCRSVRAIHIKRSNVVKDMLEAFKNGAVADQRVRVVLEGEEAEDAGGVFRDVLTEFWAQLIDGFFEGERQAVPSINSEMTSESWAAVGRILYRGYSQVKYLPLRFCMASLAYFVLGYSDDDLEVMLLDSFMAYLCTEESNILKKALQISQFPAGFSERLTDDLIDIVSRFGMRSIPTPDNIRRLALRSAEIALFERPHFPLHEMGLIQMKTLKDFESVSRIESLYKRMKPDGAKVSELLDAEPDNHIHETTLSYLKRAVETFSDDLVSRFLRFTTGSDIVNSRKIGVDFVNVTGLERRFVAHTCGPSLDVPATYSSYEEFLSELQTQLLSDHWDMDFV